MNRPEQASEITDVAPLPTLVWTRANHHRIRRVGDGTLAIVSNWDRIAVWTAAVWFALLAAVVAALSMELGPGPARFGLGVAILTGLFALGLPIVLARVGPLHAHALFDRKSGLLSLSGWRYQVRPTFRLDRVEAVQVLDAGPREEEGGAFDSYQLNLIIAEPEGDPKRLNLLHNGDREALQAMGSAVAAFLGVPLRAT